MSPIWDQPRTDVALGKSQTCVNNRSASRFADRERYERIVVLIIQGYRIRGLEMSKKKLAKLGFVVAAGASFVFSISLWFTGSKDEGMFVGLWVPSILSFGTLLLGSSHHAK